MSINAVIFDIGNVLIEWNPERFYDSVIGPDRRRRLFDAVDLYTMNATIDRGESFHDTVFALASTHPEWQVEIEMWHDRWVDFTSPAAEGTVALLRQLRARGVKVFALTNFGVETFTIAENRYPFLREFDRRYISGNLGVNKPDPEIYWMVEEDSGLDPDTLLFTDDSMDNIAAAQARGWKTHLFTGPDGWHARLISEGLLPGVET